MSSTSSSVLTLSSFNLLFFTQGKHLTLYITPIPIGINERPSLDACPVRVVSVTQFGSNGTRPAGPAGTRLFSGLPVFFPASSLLILISGHFHFHFHFPFSVGMSPGCNKLCGFPGFSAGKF